MLHSKFVVVVKPLHKKKKKKQGGVPFFIVIVFCFTVCSTSENLQEFFLTFIFCGVRYPPFNGNDVLLITYFTPLEYY